MAVTIYDPFLKGVELKRHKAEMAPVYAAKEKELKGARLAEIAKKYHVSPVCEFNGSFWFVHLKQTKFRKPGNKKDSSGVWMYLSKDPAGAVGMPRGFQIMYPGADNNLKTPVVKKCSM